MSDLHASSGTDHAADHSPRTEVPEGGDAGAAAEVQLALGGMTCASCAARIEKKLNKLDGVEATVNYATEQAHVRYELPITIDDLIGTVSSMGYTAAPPAAAPGGHGNHDADAGGRADPHAGHTGDPGDAGVVEARTRLLVSAVLTVPVLAMSMIPALQFDDWQWLALTLTAPVAVWGALPFHRAAWTNLRHGATTMDTLISLGVLAAFGWSLYALFWGTAGDGGHAMSMSFDLTPERDEVHGAGQLYLEIAAAVTTLILLGRYFETRARRRSGAALRALLELGAKDVVVLRDGAEVRIPIGDLAVGDHFVVRPGEKVATDGVVEDGTSAIDASLLTGESVPVEVGPGDTVTGATVNAGGRLVVRATRVGGDTHLAQIARLVTQAQLGKAPVQRLADRVSAVFVPVVILLAAATFAFWLLRGEPTTFAFTAAVAVLIIACPCALGLATPTALMVGTGRGAQLGILIKGPQVLESTKRIDTVVLDKTGTITTGRMSLVDVTAGAGVDESEALRLAAAVEAASEHPIAEAIADGARERLAARLPAVEGFSSTKGLGVVGTVEGRHVVAGRVRFLEEHGLSVPAELSTALDCSESAGRTAVLAGWDGQARLVLSVADTLKETSAEAVERLRRLGLRPVLLTGDNGRVAAAVAAEVGIAADDVIAEVLPEDKVAVVQRLQGEGRVVAMVGDGVNDAAALAQADLGIAMGTGTDAAIEASDLTLVRGDLRSAPDAIRLARRTLGTIKGNLFWAFAYNVAALPLAASGRLDPVVAAAAMAFSSVFVVTNSLRLRTFNAGR